MAQRDQVDRRPESERGDGSREAARDPGPATMLGELAARVGPAALQRRIQRRRAASSAPIQRQADSIGISFEGAEQASPSPRDGGAPLPSPLGARMEQSFGTSFADVRVHQGAHAEAVGARAYASGSDLHFAPGQYDPASAAGQELIGHELTHVVQQRTGRAAQPQGADGAINDDPGLEAEADVVGAAAAHGEAAPTELRGSGAPAAAGPIQRSRIKFQSGGDTIVFKVAGLKRMNFEEYLAIGGDPKLLRALRIRLLAVLGDPRSLHDDQPRDKPLDAEKEAAALVEIKAALARINALLAASDDEPASSDRASASRPADLGVGLGLHEHEDDEPPRHQQEPTGPEADPLGPDADQPALDLAPIDAPPGASSGPQMGALLSAAGTLALDTLQFAHDVLRIPSDALVDTAVVGGELLHNTATGNMNPAAFDATKPEPAPKGEPIDSYIPTSAPATDTIGLIAVPGQNIDKSFAVTLLSSPSILEQAWGHTATFARVNGQIVKVSGFALDLADAAKDGKDITAGTKSVPGTIDDDRGMFGLGSAVTIEFPVPHDVAMLFQATLPDGNHQPIDADGARARHEPSRYTAKPAMYGSSKDLDKRDPEFQDVANCGLWASARVKDFVGESLKNREGEAVTSLVPRSDQARLGESSKHASSQGKMYDYVRNGSRQPRPEGASGDPISGQYPLGAYVGGALRNVGLLAGSAYLTYEMIMEGDWTAGLALTAQVIKAASLYQDDPRLRAAADYFSSLSIAGMVVASPERGWHMIELGALLAAKKGGPAARWLAGYLFPGRR